MKYVTGLLVVAILAMVGLIAKNAVNHTSVAAAHATEVATMPAGVTFATVGAQQAMSVMGAFKGYDVIADAKGMTLYTFDKDPAGKSACNGDCAKAWPAFVAPADAKSSGFWEVITRDDGSKQYAFRGKPLYTYAEDKKPGDFKGNSVDGWHFVLNQAMLGVPLPDGIATAEVVPAGGQVFVDARSHTLYTYTGDLRADLPACATAKPQSGAQATESNDPAANNCVNHWQPLRAGELANSLGDFSVISRPDGTKQWAYQGQALYTYDLDVEKADARGRSIDPRWNIALAERYFQPEGIKFATNARGMDMLVDGKGMTIYARDRQIYQVGGFSLRGGQKGIPLLGKAMGALTCPAECAKEHPPVLAAENAIPGGYWSIAKRPDGAKQWSYNGYALYTYTKDQKPGDETSQDDFDLTLGRILPPTPSPIDAVSALYWREVTF
jgi:predicted lipoprotein with Yx(FWY)xxD motif